MNCNRFLSNIRRIRREKNNKEKENFTVLNLESKAEGFRSKINFIASWRSFKLFEVLAQPTQLHVGRQTIFVAKQAQYLSETKEINQSIIQNEQILNKQQTKRNYSYNFKHFDFLQLQPKNISFSFILLAP